MKKILKSSIFVVAIAAIIFSYIIDGVVLGESLDVTFTKKSDKYEVGGYICFKLEDVEEENVGQKIKEMVGQVMLTKKVACMEGQHISMEEEGVYCDGVKVAENNEDEMNAHNFKMKLMSEKIPSGKIYVVGENRKSVDSRVFGYVILGKNTYPARGVI